MKQKITPFLCFNGQAEEAARFYVSVFRHSSMGELKRWGEAGPGANGTVMSASFELQGQEFVALNGGPQFKFTAAISFLVDCRDQAEVDELWERLGEGGEPLQCGWLKDRFGVAWQVIPSRLGELIDDPKVFDAMLQMTKIDIARLERAHQSAR